MDWDGDDADDAADEADEAAYCADDLEDYFEPPLDVVVVRHGWSMFFEEISAAKKRKKLSDEKYQKMSFRMMISGFFTKKTHLNFYFSRPVKVNRKATALVSKIFL